MKDPHLLRMLLARDEAALSAMTRQYGGKCRQIAAQILGSEEDAQEVWNDALMHIWNAIPPAEPEDLFAYVCTAVRHLAYQRLEKRNAQKRGSGKAALSLDSMPEHSHPAKRHVEEALDAALLQESVTRFLCTLSADARTIFVHRYGNGCSIAEIARDFQITQSKVTVTLMRTRIKLKQYLNEEGWL